MFSFSSAVIIVSGFNFTSLSIKRELSHLLEMVSLGCGIKFKKEYLDRASL